MRMAPWNRKIAAATWVMVLGPLMAVLLGRGRSTSAYETAAGLPFELLEAFEFRSKVRRKLQASTEILRQERSEK